MTRIETRRGETGYSDRDRADLRKAEDVLNRMQFIARLYDPDQPRDDRGRWTGGGALEKAIDYLEKNANGGSKKKCAAFIRQALHKAGIDISADVPRSGSAKDCGPALEKHGFEKVVDAAQGEGYPPKENGDPHDKYEPESGDIVVIQDIPGHPDGHMAMYTGIAYKWVSDFRQKYFWPASEYATAKPAYVIFRYSKHA